jgi:hypothetical protein
MMVDHLNQLLQLGMGMDLLLQKTSEHYLLLLGMGMDLLLQKTSEHYLLLGMGKSLIVNKDYML